MIALESIFLCHLKSIAYHIISITYLLFSFYLIREDLHFDVLARIDLNQRRSSTTPTKSKPSQRQHTSPSTAHPCALPS
jgi:hypothetical protein